MLKRGSLLQNVRLLLAPVARPLVVPPPHPCPVVALLLLVLSRHLPSPEVGCWGILALVVVVVVLLLLLLVVVLEAILRPRAMLRLHQHREDGLAGRVARWPHSL